MARHSHSQSVINTVQTPAPVRPEGFMSLQEVDAVIKQLNRKERQLSRHRKIRSVGEVRHLTPDELNRLAYLVAARQNRPVR